MTFCNKNSRDPNPNPKANSLRQFTTDFSTDLSSYARAVAKLAALRLVVLNPNRLLSAMRAHASATGHLPGKAADSALAAA